MQSINLSCMEPWQEKKALQLHFLLLQLFSAGMSEVLQLEYWIEITFTVCTVSITYSIQKCSDQYKKMTDLNELLTCSSLIIIIYIYFIFIILYFLFKLSERCASRSLVSNNYKWLLRAMTEKTCNLDQNYQVEARLDNPEISQRIQSLVQGWINEVSSCGAMWGTRGQLSMMQLNPEIPPLPAESEIRLIKWIVESNH